MKSWRANIHLRLMMKTGKAVNCAAEMFSSLHAAFSEKADDFLAKIKKILSSLSAAIHFTDQWKALKVNPEIDNT